MTNFRILQEINDIKDGTTVVKKAEQIGGKTASGTLNTTEKTDLVIAINQCFQHASDGKAAIVAALISMGVQASANESFSSLAAKITTELAKKQGTAVAADALKGKTFVNNTGGLITGTIPSKAAATITPGTSNQTIAAGQYLSGIQTIAGDVDLVAGNIRSGANIFGVSGSVVELRSAVTFTVSVKNILMIGGGDIIDSVSGKSKRISTTTTKVTDFAYSVYSASQIGFLFTVRLGSASSVLSMSVSRGTLTEISSSGSAEKTVRWTFPPSLATIGLTLNINT